MAQDQQAAIAEMLRLMQQDPERYPEETDVPDPDIGSRDYQSVVPSVGASEQEILDVLSKMGAVEQVRPNVMTEGGEAPTGNVPGYRMGSPEAGRLADEAYKFDRQRENPILNDLIRGFEQPEVGGGHFESGGARIPLGLWKPRDVERYGPGSPYGSYLDPNKRDLLMPRMSPGTQMRSGEYNQGRDEVMKFLNKLLGPEMY